jgi:hypothetical protein
LDHPNQEELERFFSIDSVIIIEERRNEKYKIFPKKDPQDIIEQLIDIFGLNMFNFRKVKVSLSEFTELIELESQII